MKTVKNIVTEQSAYLHASPMISNAVWNKVYYNVNRIIFVNTFLPIILLQLKNK